MKGARYEFTSSYTGSGVLQLQADSPLYQALCGSSEWLGLRGGRMLTTPLGVGAPEVCSFQPTVILQQDIPHGASVVIVFSHASLFNPII